MTDNTKDKDVIVVDISTTTITTKTKDVIPITSLKEASYIDYDKGF